jgi:hypothetical protein
MVNAAACDEQVLVFGSFFFSICSQKLNGSGNSPAECSLFLDKGPVIYIRGLSQISLCRPFENLDHFQRNYT